MELTKFKVPEFSWYGSLQGIDGSNWPIWLVAGVLGVVIIVGLGYLFDKVL